MPSGMKKRPRYSISNLQLGYSRALGLLGVGEEHSRSECAQYSPGDNHAPKDVPAELTFPFRIVEINHGRIQSSVTNG